MKKISVFNLILGFLYGVLTLFYILQAGRFADMIEPLFVIYTIITFIVFFCSTMISINVLKEANKKEKWYSNSLLYFKTSLLFLMYYAAATLVLPMYRENMADIKAVITFIILGIAITLFIVSLFINLMKNIVNSGKTSYYVIVSLTVVIYGLSLWGAFAVTTATYSAYREKIINKENIYDEHSRLIFRGQFGLESRDYILYNKDSNNLHFKVIEKNLEDTNLRNHLTEEAILVTEISINYHGKNITKHEMMQTLYVIDSFYQKFGSKYYMKTAYHITEYTHSANKMSASSESFISNFSLSKEEYENHDYQIVLPDVTKTNSSYQVVIETSIIDSDVYNCKYKRVTLNRETLKSEFTLQKYQEVYNRLSDYNTLDYSTSYLLQKNQYAQFKYFSYKNDTYMIPIDRDKLFFNYNFSQWGTEKISKNDIGIIHTQYTSQKHESLLWSASLEFASSAMNIYKALPNNSEYNNKDTIYNNNPIYSFVLGGYIAL